VGGKDRSQVSPPVIANLYTFLNDMVARQTNALKEAIDPQEKILKEAMSRQEMAMSSQDKKSDKP
jgi:hypothetical protein